MASGGEYSTVIDQMEVLESKAYPLALKDSILGHLVVFQLKQLQNIARKGVAEVLQAAEEKEIKVSRGLEEWLEKVNAAILEADDVLDECEYLVHSGEKNLPNKFFSSTTLFLGMLRRSERLKSVNSTLQKALKKVAEFSTEVSWNIAPRGRSAAAQATKDSSEIESLFVGETEDVKGIVDKLLTSSSETDLSIFTLVGWAETGKTALARLLYKNSEVMFYFDERMWVQAPGDLNVEAIAKRMLDSLIRTTDIDSVADQHSEGLQKRLKGKRFLLVLVDASDLNNTKFRSLKKYLVNLGSSRGSNLLITTGSRPNKNIDVSFEQEMKLGEGDYCRQLLDRIAFAVEGPSRTLRMEELVKTMAELCARDSHIKLLGSLLYRLKQEREWFSIRNELKYPGEIPQLCFDHMSSIPLKRCFLYCYFFPKGCLIRREELIELWMAQGYLNASEDDDFDAQSCKVPDELHGLNSFTESSSECYKTITEGGAKDFSGAYSHLTVIRCDEKHKKSFNDRHLKLRSLRLENTSKGLSHFLAHARRLRVLIVMDASLEELPDSIGKLISLRYLDISGTSIVRLPNSISMLYNLQTLKLHDLKELPDNFGNLLVRMMHLCIQKLEDVYDMHDLLSSCGELVYLSFPKVSLKVFLDNEREQKNDKKLNISSRTFSTISIHCLENASKGGTSAWISENLETESLELNWSAIKKYRIDEDVLVELKPRQGLKNLTLQNFRGTEFPDWMMKDDSIHEQLSNLVKLELENCSCCEQLPTLGRFPCLRVLKIVGMDNVKSISEDFYGGGTTTGPVFAKIKEFTLCGMSKLRDWSGSKYSSTTAFPCLEWFEVDQCPSLIVIPDILLSGEPKCFRRFKVSHCRNLVNLPRGLERLECLENLELFGLPALEQFSFGSATNLKSLIIGCMFSKLAQEEEMLKQLEKLTCLTNLKIWGYNKESIPDCLGNLGSLQVLKFESCKHLKILPRISSLRELHISCCQPLEESCIIGSRPEWRKVSHIQTIFVNNEKIRHPPTTEKMP